MNRKLVQTLFLMVLMAGTILSAPAARADLVVTLDNPVQNAYPGDTLSFFGSITNDGTTGTVYMNGDAFNVGAPITGDDSPFFATPPFLDPNDSFSGLLFTLTIPSNVNPYMTFSGTFQILGDTTGMGGSDPVSNEVSFAVNTVPEPASLALLGSGLTGLVGVIRRKRQSQHS